MAAAAASKRGLGVEGFVLVMPAVAVGNVGQLAVDALLATYPVRRLGALYLPSVLPVCGYTRDGALVTAVEAFACDERRVVLLQQRAPVVAARRREFLDGVLQWAAQAGVQEIVLLTSARAADRTEAQILGTQLRFAASSAYADAARIANALGWRRCGEDERAEQRRMMEREAERLAEMAGALDSPQLGDDEVKGAPPAPGPEPATPAFTLRGAGVTRHFLEESERRGARLLALCAFSNEGLNLQGAFALAAAAEAFLAQRLAWKQPLTAQWRAPPEWEGLLGPAPAPDADLYE